jgi:hypothetical protein
VFGSVDTESFDSQVDKIVDVVSHFLPYVVLTTVQVVQADQIAVTDLIGVLVIADLAVGLVEISTSEGNSRVFLISSVATGASSTSSRSEIGSVSNDSLLVMLVI